MLSDREILAMIAMPWVAAAAVLTGEVAWWSYPIEFAPVLAAAISLPWVSIYRSRKIKKEEA